MVRRPVAASPARRPADASWTLLSNHGHVLVCIAEDPDVRLADIAARVGIRERAAHRIVTDLVEAGYLTRSKQGRRNHYAISPDMPLRHPLERAHAVGELLETLTSYRAPSPASATSTRTRRHGQAGSSS